MEIGKYYKLTFKYNRNDTYHFKLLKIEDNKLIHTDFYLENYIFYNSNVVDPYFPIGDYSYYYEQVDLSEIVGYLPIGHPERILYRNNRIKSLLNSF